MSRLTYLAVALSLLVSPAAAQQRLALVIGNSSYAEAPLKNPVNDARSMATELRGQGFEVILRENAGRRDMELAIADFGEKLNEGATGLFFYAGHGMQVQGRNYLVPIDARLSAEARVRFEAVDVDGVLDQMQAARAKVSMVILDACRNNPYERRFRSGGAGLAQLSAPEGTLIAYATAPGKVASDGDGTNGLYTREFVRAMRTPGLRVEDVFKQVRANVSRASGGAQVPWEASSLTGDFYFVPPKPVAPPPPVAAPAPPPGPSPQSLDLAFWESVKGSSNPAELQAYMQSFPDGTFVPLAQARLAALTKPATAPAPPRAAAELDGRYTTKFTGPRGSLDATLDIEGTKINGFGYVVSGDSMANSGLNRLCRMSGTLDRAGTIERLALNCDSYSWAFSGRFMPDETGRYSATTLGRSLDGNVTAVWTKSVAAVSTTAAAVPAPQAALPPVPDNAVELALWDSVKTASNPRELQAYLDRYPDGAFAAVARARIAAASRAPAARDGAFDGVYTANFAGPKGRVQATLEIRGTAITGYANPGEQTNPWASNNFCRAKGTLNAAGVIGTLEMECSAYGWVFSGRVVPGNDGTHTLETSGRSNSATDVTVSWKKSGS